MAEDRFDSRETNFRQWLPWTLLFRGFWLALDHKKLILAAAGILMMALGWWVLAYFFLNIVPGSKPVWPTDYPSANYQDGEQGAWTAFKADRRIWNLRYEAAGPGPGSRPEGKDDGYADAGDLASTPEEFKKIEVDSARRTYRIDDKELPLPVKPHGRLRTWPWFEERGPNPALLIIGRAGIRDEAGATQAVPWEKGGFLDWLVRDQVPVLIEPLVKFLRPVGYFLHPGAGAINRLYFLLVIVWTLGVWAIIGGAITRIAAVQLARDERVGIAEAVRFALSRWRSYFFASYAPLLGVAAIVIALNLFGIGNLIPVFAEFWDGILWGLVLLLGFVIAFILVGLVGWPMIHTTLSTEGSDSFDALSRSYSYVYQKPWNYVWCVVVALVYGALVVFFVGLMGSLMIYLGKWGIALTSYFNRDPSYLFIWAPTSFGWRELLLQGSPVMAENPANMQAAIAAYTSGSSFHWWNYIGPFFVAIWLGLAFLIVIGFSYSYFWSASTIIYLLMRKKVDDTELDEVYLEQEDLDEAYHHSPIAPEPQPASPAAMHIVEASSIRPSTSPATPADKPTGVSGTGDGNPPREPPVSS
jgi:hypothetical protein